MKMLLLTRLDKHGQCQSLPGSLVPEHAHFSFNFYSTRSVWSRFDHVVYEISNFQDEFIEWLDSKDTGRERR